MTTGAAPREGSPDQTLEGAQDPAALAFLDFLAGLRPAVEAGLRARWDDKLRDSEVYGAEVTTMVTEARSLTLRGGKRFRAGLLVAAHLGVAPDAPIDPAIDAAVALELLQTYLLIQDDWIDGDATRRGGPSVHAALGEAFGSERLGAATAVLASDLTWGLAVAALAAAKAPPQAVVAAIQVLCRVHDDVVIGQHIDVLAHADDVEQMHALKTGSYTVRGPLLIGATLAGAGADVISALSRFAAPVGVAFQLRDDLLGTFGCEAETGKPVGSDLRAGKRTAVRAWAEAHLDASAQRALDRVLGRSEATPAEVADATSALEACGARRVVEERLEALCAEAEARASDLPITERARLLLRGAASALRRR